MNEDTYKTYTQAMVDIILDPGLVCLVLQEYEGTSEEVKSKIPISRKIMHRDVFKNSTLYCQRELQVIYDYTLNNMLRKDLQSVCIYHYMTDEVKFPPILLIDLFLFILYMNTKNYRPFDITPSGLWMVVGQRYKELFVHLLRAMGISNILNSSTSDINIHSLCHTPQDWATDLIKLKYPFINPYTGAEHEKPPC